MNEEDFANIEKRQDGKLEARVKNITLPQVHVDEIDEDKELEKTERGRIVRERRVFLKEYDRFVEEQKWGSYMIVTGITLFVVGSWSLIVPLYKLV